jgi:hypothetical protein
VQESALTHGALTRALEILHAGGSNTVFGKGQGVSLDLEAIAFQVSCCVSACRIEKGTPRKSTNKLFAAILLIFSEK